MRHVEEVFDDLEPIFGQDRFGMKLHSIHWSCAMADSHDDTLIPAGGDPEVRGETRFIDGKRVVASDPQWMPATLKQILAVMLDRR